MIQHPDWSVLALNRLPTWPEYAAARSVTPDGQGGIAAATTTPPNPKPVKVWIPGVFSAVSHKMTDRLVKDAIGHLLTTEATR